MEENIILRAEKIREIGEALKTGNILYISAFYGSGKTVLLDQTAAAAVEEWGKTVIRFDAASGKWEAFAEKLARTDYDKENTLFMFDSLHSADSDTLGKLSEFLRKLPEKAQAILCGRAKVPEKMNGMVLRGDMRILDVDFVMFTKSEITELFGTYEISLRNEDVLYLKTQAWGWVLMLHAVAEKLGDSPAVPISSMRLGIGERFGETFLKDIVYRLPDDEITLLFGLSILDSFDGETARAVTGLDNAPALMDGIAARSYIIMRENSDLYSFIPFVKNALFRELKRQKSTAQINDLFKCAGKHFADRDMIPEAAKMYIQANDLGALKLLLIHSAEKRPGTSELSELLEAYDEMPREMILEHPLLIKGKCIAESLRGRATASEMWYDELKAYIANAPKGSPERRTAEEAAAYLDIGLAQRGTGNILRLLLSAAKKSRLTSSGEWSTGFNIAGNSVSLMNGGKDFCRWVPKGYEIYKRFRVPVEMAVGRGGSGLADIAIAECELESRLDGDYTNAADYVIKGLSCVTDDIEMRCAGQGIQSRIFAARGMIEDAIEITDNIIDRLPRSAPRRLQENLAVHKLTLQLMQGYNEDAYEWLELRSPSEMNAFSILDRYAYILKMRLYIMLGMWDKAKYLAALLRNYAESYDRPYIRIKVHIFEAEIFRRNDNMQWREEMREALTLARKYKLVRVIADEGAPAESMIKALKPRKDEWLNAVLRLTQLQAGYYPGYMATQSERPAFTENEMLVWAQLVKGLKNKEIAAALGFTERNVKYHTIEIYKKLGVNSRAEAIKKAAEIGEI